MGEYEEAAEAFPVDVVVVRLLKVEAGPSQAVVTPNSAPRLLAGARICY